MTAGDVNVVRGSLDSRQCVAFDGTDDYILADAHAVARVAAGDTVGTYTAWIYSDETTGNTTILSAGDNSSTDEYINFYLQGNQLSVILKHGGANQFIVREIPASIPKKKWTHVALVQNGTQPALYVNGLARTITNAVSTDLTMWYGDLTLTDKFAIGVLESNNTHTNDFVGMISNVKYWNRVLSAAEILLDFNGEVLTNDATYLQSHWDMDGDVTDAGVGADNGTPAGHAYNHGWGSEWSRQVELNGLVADDHYNLTPDSAGNQTTLILKAA